MVVVEKTWEMPERSNTQQELSWLLMKLKLSVEDDDSSENAEEDLPTVVMRALLIRTDNYCQA